MGLNDQLLSITNNGKQTLFEYDGWGNLAKATYPDGKVELRNPDKTGNLFETVDRIDRKYSAGERLEQSKDWTYKYDDEGHLTEKRHRVQVQQAWKYRWNDAGMLEEVVRPDGSTVSFKYDALGRRIEKRLFNRKTRWVWDGNVPLHEWNEVYTKDFTEEKGEFYSMKPSKTTTWLFEEGTFVPNGKLVGEESFSIQSNYLGTLEVMYNADGKVVWSAELDAYGDVRELTGERTDCPFRYQGQYEDRETGLYYNRFRYYSAEEGMYISQDPIRLYGGAKSLYRYVYNTNIEIDTFGLYVGSYSSQKNKVKKEETSNVEVHHIPPKAALAANGKPEYGTPAIVMSKEDHAKTASYGGAGQAYVNEQAASIARTGSYYEAMSRDIADVQSISRKYDDDLMNAINYAEKKKMIKADEANQLRKQCKQA